MFTTSRLACLLFFLSSFAIMSCSEDDDLTSDLNGVWIEGSWTTMNVTGMDTTWVAGEYIGDGVCCGVTTVTVTGTDYVTNETVTVDGTSYLIIEYIADPNDLDSGYKYQMDLEIVTPCNGCKSSLELFKRS
jgi:hypothetical protein